MREAGMDSVRDWKASIEQAAIDDYGYRSDEASKFTGDMFDDDVEDIFDDEEPDFSDIDA
jgi:hypothetical protein